MNRRPFAHLTEAVVTDHRTRRGILRLAAGAGAGVASMLSAVAALGKKKHKKKKCKKPKPVTLQTALVSCPGPAIDATAGSRRHAQTFVAARTGALTTALVEISAEAGEAVFIIEIRAVDSDGVPTDEILASAEVNAVLVTLSFPLPTVAALFDPPASVVKDDVYALAVTAVSGVGYRIGANFADICAGEFFRDEAADGSFTPIAGRDMVFTVSITFAA